MKNALNGKPAFVKLTGKGQRRLQMTESEFHGQNAFAHRTTIIRASGDYMVMNDATREVLEAIRTLSKSGGPMRGGWVPYHELFAYQFKNPACNEISVSDWIAMFDEKDWIETKPIDSRNGSMKLTGTGIAALLMPQSSTLPTAPIVNFHGHGNTFAHASGENSTVNVNNTFVNDGERQALAGLVIKLIDELKAHPDVPADTVIEAEQLQLETKKTNIRLATVGAILTTIKVTVHMIPTVLDIIEQIKYAVPGLEKILER